LCEWHWHARVAADLPERVVRFKAKEAMDDVGMV
jgi:hypothetical protein